MKQRQKNNKTKYIIVVTIVIILSIIAMTVYSVTTNRELTFFEKAIRDSVLYVGEIIYTPIDYIEHKLNHKDNNISDSDKQIIERYKAQLLEVQKENEELENLLQLNKSLSQYQYINATVINRDMGYWYNTLTIDKGSLDGIELDMAVIIDGGLIGKISSVSNFNSTVKLLTTGDLINKISVKIESNDDYIYGLLSGYDEKTNTYTIDGISTNLDISDGAIITTTGLSNNFPSGILVGHVKEVTTDNFDLSRIVKVTPSVNFDNISYVMVLKREATS